MYQIQFRDRNVRLKWRKVDLLHLERMTGQPLLAQENNWFETLGAEKAYALIACGIAHEYPNLSVDEVAEGLPDEESFIGLANAVCSEFRRQHIPPSEDELKKSKSLDETESPDRAEPLQSGSNEKRTSSASTLQTATA